MSLVMIVNCSPLAGALSVRSPASQPVLIPCGAISPLPIRRTFRKRCCDSSSASPTSAKTCARGGSRRSSTAPTNSRNSFSPQRRQRKQITNHKKGTKDHEGKNRACHFPSWYFVTFVVNDFIFPLCLCVSVSLCLCGETDAVCA